MKIYTGNKIIVIVFFSVLPEINTLINMCFYWQSTITMLCNNAVMLIYIEERCNV